jgi:Sugar (and other) transporter
MSPDDLPSQLSHSADFAFDMVGMTYPQGGSLAKRDGTTQRSRIKCSLPLPYSSSSSSFCPSYPTECYIHASALFLDVYFVPHSPGLIPKTHSPWGSCSRSPLMSPVRPGLPSSLVSQRKRQAPSLPANCPPFAGIFVAFGGILFGYDTGTISGIIAMPFWLKGFAKGHMVNGELALTPGDESLIVSILSLGTFLGALTAAPCADFFGRRLGLILSTGIVFNLGVLLQTIATSQPLFIAGRFFAGYGVGLISPQGESPDALHPHKHAHYFPFLPFRPKKTPPHH